MNLTREQLIKLRNNARQQFIINMKRSKSCVKVDEFHILVSLADRYNKRAKDYQKQLDYEYFAKPE